MEKCEKYFYYFNVFYAPIKYSNFLIVQNDVVGLMMYNTIFIKNMKKVNNLRDPISLIFIGGHKN